MTITKKKEESWNSSGNKDDQWSSKDAGNNGQWNSKDSEKNDKWGSKDTSWEKKDSKWGGSDGSKDASKDEWWKKDDKPKEDSKDEWWKQDKGKDAWSENTGGNDASWQGANGQREDAHTGNEESLPEEEPPEEAPLLDAPGSVVSAFLGKRPAEDYDDADEQPSKCARVDDVEVMESSTSVEELVQTGEGAKCSVGDLKYWLEERGLPTNGIKATLIERIQEELTQAEPGTA